MDFDLLKTTPYAHQREALDRSATREFYAFFMEMGTGKTKVAIDNATFLFDRGEIDAVLVVAPKGVYRNWEGELAAHLPEVSHRIAVWRAAPRRSEARDLEECLKPGNGFVWLLMNVEAFSTTKGEKFAERFLCSHRTMMVVDESTTIKNPKAVRTKAILALRHLPVYRRILTGAPVTRDPLDLFAPCMFLHPRALCFKSYYAMRARHAVLQAMRFGEKRFQQVVGYQRLDELSDKLDAFSFRCLKSECLDLPPKVYEQRTVEMNPEQAKAYTAMRDEACAELDGQKVSAPLILARLTRLHQIVTGALGSPSPNRRLEALLETLEEVSGKAIIWATYRDDLTVIVLALMERYGPLSAVLYHGGTPAEDRPGCVRSFQEDEQTRFFVGQPQTGGYGLTLTAASTVIYYSNSFNLELRIQSEDRAHRIGQFHPVTYVDLVTPHTIDEKILEALRAKQDIANLVLREEWREWL
ncbi:MAG: DEAD/DEAH box helicase [Planctomycetota bacterium]|jgi:SNF2 family DNA or RNA helicase